MPGGVMDGSLVSVRKKYIKKGITTGTRDRTTVLGPVGPLQTRATLPKAGPQNLTYTDKPSIRKGKIPNRRQRGGSSCRYQKIVAKLHQATLLGAIKASELLRPGRYF